MKFWLIVLVFLFSSSCSLTKLKDSIWKKVEKNDEFEQMVQVKEIDNKAKSNETVEQPKEEKSKLIATTSATETIASSKENINKTDLIDKKPSKKKKKSKAKEKKLSLKDESKNINKKDNENEGKDLASQEVKSLRREPLLEDDSGFHGRRPIVEPFHIGEKTKLRLSYFGVTAGFLTMEIAPYVEVNGRKCYRLLTNVDSNESFDWVYSVKDHAEAFLDYETLIPYTYTLEVKESSQMAHTRLFFDWPKMKAIFWDKRYSKSRGQEDKKYDWDIVPYVQNVFTAGFYMRIFQYKVGKEIAFQVANEGENVVYKAKVLRKEKIETEAGVFDTVVIQPKIEIKGVFTPVGEILMWLTDDDRKFLVKFESKIQIGTIKGEAIEVIK